MFGHGIMGVSLKRKQFSCWNKNDANRAKMQEISQLPEGHPDKVRWEQAKKLAERIVSGEDSDPTNGALFYHTTDVNPVWAKGVKPTGQYANHVFYDDFARAPTTA